MGETTFAHVRAEFDSRHKEGDFRQLKGEKHATGRSFTTGETIANERANVRHVMTGQNTVEPMMNREQAAAHAASGKFFNEAQRGVITDVLTSRDRSTAYRDLSELARLPSLPASAREPKPTATRSKVSPSRHAQPGSFERKESRPPRSKISSPEARTISARPLLAQISTCSKNRALPAPNRREPSSKRSNSRTRYW